MELTRKQIEEMMPGAATNALLAEKILDWKRYGAIRFGAPAVILVEQSKDCYRFTRTQGDAKKGGWAPSTDEVTTWEGVPELSYDMNQSLAIEQAMQGKGFWMKLHSPFEPGQLWWASFDLHGHTDSRPQFMAGAHYPQIAIYRAALLALFDL